jgi:hypothetical protein
LRIRSGKLGNLVHCCVMLIVAQLGRHGKTGKMESA